MKNASSVRWCRTLCLSCPADKLLDRGSKFLLDFLFTVFRGLFVRHFTVEANWEFARMGEDVYVWAKW